MKYRHRTLTSVEESRLACALAATAIMMGLKGNQKLPQDIKL